MCIYVPHLESKSVRALDHQFNRSGIKNVSLRWTQLELGAAVDRQDHTKDNDDDNDKSFSSSHDKCASEYHQQYHTKDIDDDNDESFSSFPR